MKTEDIVKAAEERLVEIEAEAVKLRAIIAAAKGPSIAPFVPLPVLPTLPFHPAQPTQPRSPNIPWPFDGFTYATWTIHNVGTQISANGVSPTLDGFIVGGPQRMNPNVRFTS